MNKALASYPLAGPKPKSPRPPARLSRSSSKGAPRARTGRYATQLEALVHAHK